MGFLNFFLLSFCADGISGINDTPLKMLSMGFLNYFLLACRRCGLSALGFFVGRLLHDLRFYTFLLLTTMCEV